MFEGTYVHRYGDEAFARVILLADLKGTEEQDISVLKLEGLPEIASQLPEGYRIHGGDRKFVVLVEDGDYDVTLVIAPLGTCMHKQLVEVGKRLLPDAVVKGGGRFRVSCYPPDGGWSAELTGFSHDYGKYWDNLQCYGSLERMKALEGVLGMSIWCE